MQKHVDLVDLVKSFPTTIYLQNFVIFQFFSLIFAQILMKFCRNFADNLENVEFFWNFEFSKENSWILKEFESFEWFEWFEWFGPSPIEPFNSDEHPMLSQGRERRSRNRGLLRLKRDALLPLWQVANNHVQVVWEAECERKLPAQYLPEILIAD